MSNPFLTKKDPLLEAVRIAMQDGETRRQAEELVNEEFGVYSRKAVVREQLAAYDARLEEAYKCMKEGEKPAKKDYDRDGKIESEKDEVWGSRFRAAKMAGKMEETSHLSPKQKRMAAKHKNKLKDNIKYSLGKHAKPNLPESYFYEGEDEDYMKKFAGSENPAAGVKAVPKKKRMTARERLISKLGPGKVKAKPDSIEHTKRGREMGDYDVYKSYERKGNKIGRHQSTIEIEREEYELAEAAYSAKAARAGKDIGKPGKMFSKIASKAGEKYGSEERGKKVAGAILKRIRAKHMKEESDSVSPKNDKESKGIIRSFDPDQNAAKEVRKGFEGSKGEIRDPKSDPNKYPGL